VCRAHLAAARAVDQRRRRGTFGPHLDELEIALDGHALRAVGSQGQHRAVTLALKIAELGSIAAARAVEPLLLLDDVSSELDEQRAESLFAHLATTRSQIFLTTTRRRLIVAPELEGADRRDFEICAGELRAL
jgi:DNA replication and repair protein RecF